MDQRHILASSVSVLVALYCSPAAAQATGKEAPLAASPPGAVDEIVVTAQKKSESLQRAPAAITVVSGAEVVSRGLVDIRGLENLIPSAKTNVEATATQVFIRGVGKQVDQNKIADAVGTMLDGVYIPQHATALGIYDLASVEVLPGPQGTLYGTASIGGVVNIKTTRPGKDFGGSALVEIGNYSYKHITAVLNVPVSADLSLRGAYNGSYRNGYNSNGTSDDNATSARLSALYAPAGDLTIFLSGSYFFDRYRQSPAQYHPYPDGDAYRFPANDASTAAFYPPDGATNDPGKTRQRIIALYGQVDYDFGGVTLSYIPGFLRQTNPGHAPGENTDNVGGFPESQHTTIDQFTNELRLSNSSGHPISWLLGVYQLHSKDHQDYTFGPNLGGVDNNDRWNSYAAFGQLTYSPVTGTRLTTGARVSKDSLRSVNSDVIFPILPSFSRGMLPFDFRGVWKRVNWKVGAEQDISPHSMAYVTVQSGFNPGTYDGNLPDPAREVKPQRMIGYTLGIKNTFFGSRLRLNAEGYLYQYRNQIIQANDLSTGFTSLFNAPKSQIKGFQIDAAYSLASKTKLYATIGYLDAEFKKFSAATAAGTVQSYAGYQLPFSPSWTVAAGAGHSFDFSDGGSIEARVDTYFSSSYWVTFGHTSDLQQRSFTKTDVSLTYSSPNGRWQIGAWAKNLENKATIATGGETGRPYPFAGAVYVGPPRTYGLRLASKF